MLRTTLFRRLPLLAAALLALLSGQARAAATARVIHVMDGSTIRIMYLGNKDILRLIGVDASPAEQGRDLSKQARRLNTDETTLMKEGIAAKACLQTLVKYDDEILIELDVIRRDRYGRLLAYAFLSSGTHINAYLLLSGMARPLIRSPNIRYQFEFEMAARAAKERGYGLWKNYPPKI